MNKFTPEQELWLKELETTDKLQGEGYLCRFIEDQPRFCCLGVGCELFNFESRRSDNYHTHTHLLYGNSQSSDFSPELADKLLMRSKDGTFAHNVSVKLMDKNLEQLTATCIATLNDHLKLTFKEIAKFIRTYPWAVFTNFEAPLNIPAEIIILEDGSYQER